MKIALNQSQIDAAEIQFRQTMTPENRPVRDDVITPFVIGLKLAGYELATNQFGCDVLSICPQCRNGHSRHQILCDGIKMWACAYCNNLDT